MPPKHRHQAMIQPSRFRIPCHVLAFVLSFVMAASSRGAKAAGVNFDREIRPILASNCFACHGPDAAERKSDLRLDTKEGIFGDLGGHAAVLPGKVEESELVNRV